MKRVLLVGTGPSGYAVLNSLQTTDELWVMDGQSNFNENPVSAQSHLALKLKFGSSHTYVNPDDVGLLNDKSFQLPISYSRGGFGEVWGNGFTPYDYSEIDPTSDDGLRMSIKTAMRDLLELIPFTHAPGQLDSRFGSIENWGPPVYGRSLLLSPIFEDFLKNRAPVEEDGLVFGQPNILLDSTKCKKCGLCLTGCPYGALFDPGEQINRILYKKKLSSTQFLKGIVSEVKPIENGVEVVYTICNEKKKEIFDEVILSTGPLSTAIILMNSGLLPKVFNVPDSQVFYSAFWSWKRIRPREERQEVGELVCYPLNASSDDFQISFYSPSQTSRKRISHNIFPKHLRFFKIPKSLSERLIPVIGFLPQSSSGKIQLQKTVHGIEISRLPNQISKKAIRRSLNHVAKTMRTASLVHLPWAMRIPLPGSGFHIGASLPLNSEHLDKLGQLRIVPSIKVLDASILPKIPAGAHTFLTMAIISNLLKVEQ